MTQLGFVGLGQMGSRIANRLLAAGYPVAGYNRTAAKAAALVAAGMHLHGSPREVAEASDIVFSMVTDDAALRAITDGDNGILAGLAAGKTYVDMSTVSARLIRDLAQRVAATGANMLDAPVSGSLPAAEGGTLIIFAGGEADVLENARPVFETISQKIIHAGANGHGIAIKIAINLSLPIQLIALFDGVLLAERSGVPRAAALDALLNSVIASPAMKYRAPFALNPPAEVWFDVDMMLKDIELALELGAETGVVVPGVKLAHDLLLKAREMGYGDQDFASLLHVLAKLSGMA